MESDEILITIQVIATQRMQNVNIFFFLLYLSLLTRTFPNHRIAGEGGGHFRNSSLPLPLASQTLRH